MTSSPSTVSTSSSPPPQVLGAYTNLTNAASGVAQNPLQLYNGPMVAGFTPQQQAGFQTIDQAQGIGYPYVNTAAQEFNAATTPLWPTLPQFSADTVNQYMSPYTQDVTGSLTNLFNQQNAQQQQQIQGNATAQNAYGGDREAVAQALGTQQEQLAQAPTLAQVEQQGYQSGVGEFNTQQQQQLAAEQANAWLSSQAGFGMAGLGTQAQNMALTGANAELGAGGMQQQQAQQLLNIPYQQFVQTQSYPYQQLGFLSPIVEGTGSLSGGTGSTTYPPPSPLSQAAGVGLAGAGVYGLGSSAGWWGSPSTAADASLGSSFYSYGGFPMSKSGGRIGYAMGGVPMMPHPPGIGAQVPDVNLSFIPQPAPMPTPSSMGLHLGPVTTTTQSGGGGGLLSSLGPIVGLARLAMSLKEGGAAHGHYNSGGTATPPLAPTVPPINLDYIIHPGPAVKGSGPPQPPRVNPNDQSGGSGFGLQQGMQALGGIGQLKKSGLFGDSGSSAEGGRIGYQSGGDVPLAVAAAFGGAPPNESQSYQQLLQLPLQRLQEMAVQFPPTTQQGKLVQQALSQKRATPSSGTATGAPVAAAPIGSQLAPTGAPASAPTGTASLAAQGQDYGGTSHTMADGGAAGPGFVMPEELDPTPIVDHSGDTIKIRYPSENKTLDLGLPSMKPEKFAAGGATGAAAMGFSEVAWPSGSAGWSVVGAPVNPSPSSAPAASGALTAGNGVAIPTLGSPPPTAGGISPGFQPGGGVENWFQPVQTPYNSVASVGGGPGGSTFFDSSPAFVPGMNPVFTGLGGSGAVVPQWAGGAAPTSVAPSPTTAPPPSTGPAAGQFGSYQPMYAIGGAITNASHELRPRRESGGAAGSPSNNGSVSSEGWIEPPPDTSHIGYEPSTWPPLPSSPPPPLRHEKMGRAGIGHYQGGGDIIATADIPPPIPADSDLPGGGFDFGTGLGAPSGAAGTDLPQPVADDLSMLGLPPAQYALSTTLPKDRDSVGEPAAPAAMVTPDRAPPPQEMPQAARDAGYTDREWSAARNRGMIMDNGLPTVPPGTPLNSKGMFYTPTPEADRARAEETDRSFAANQAAGKPWAGLDDIEPVAATATPPLSGTPGTGGMDPNKPPSGTPSAGAGSEYPAWLDDAIIAREGSGDQSVSPKGAIGRNQVMPSTAAQYGADRAALFNPERNMQVGNQIRRDLWAKYHDPTAVMVAYNAGPGVAARWLAAGKDPTVLPAETRAYIGAASGTGAGAPGGSLATTGPAPDQLVGQTASAAPFQHVGYAQQQGATPDYMSAVNEILKDISSRSKSGGNMMASPWLPVIAAGLGIMASPSHYPGVAIGQGGLAGLKMLEQQQAELPANELKQVQADMARLGMATLPAKMALAAQMANESAGAPIGTGGGGSAVPMAGRMATAPAASIASPQSGLPLPPNYGQSAANSTDSIYDQQYAQLDQQIANVRRAAILEPDKLAEQQATIARLMNSRASLMAQDPRMAGARAGAEAQARVNPGIEEAGGKARIEYPYRVGESLAREAAIPRTVRPGEAVTTGFAAMPDWMQRGILNGPGGVAAGMGPSETAAQSAPAPSSAAPAATSATIPAAGPPVAAVSSAVPPFAQPADIAPDPTLTMPQARLAPLPGGGMTAVPTLPGIADLQNRTGDLAADAQKNIPVLAQARSALDTQHEELMQAARPGNFYTSGSFIDARRKIGNLINTVADAIPGAAQYRLQPQDLANSTAIDKSAFNLSTQAVHGISARPAQIEWQAARQNVPSAVMPAFSSLLLSNTLRMQNQYQMGQHEFELQQWKRGADPSAAAALWQHMNGDRIADSALALTYVDLARARPNDPMFTPVRQLLAIASEHRAEAVKLFDEGFKPLQGVPIGVPSFGALITQLAQGG